MRRCNGEVELGSKALDDVLYRSQLELFPEALLVGTIIIHLYTYFYFLFFLNYLWLWIRGVNLCVSLWAWDLRCANCTVVLLHPHNTVLYCVSLRVFVRDCKQSVIPLDYLHAFHSASLSCNPWGPGSRGLNLISQYCYTSQGVLCHNNQTTWPLDSH